MPSRGQDAEPCSFKLAILPPDLVVTALLKRGLAVRNLDCVGVLRVAFGGGCYHTKCNTTVNLITKYTKYNYNHKCDKKMNQL